MGLAVLCGVAKAQGVADGHVLSSTAVSRVFGDGRKLEIVVQDWLFEQHK